MARRAEQARGVKLGYMATGKVLICSASVDREHSGFVYQAPVRSGTRSREGAPRMINLYALDVQICGFGCSGRPDWSAAMPGHESCQPAVAVRVVHLRELVLTTGLPN